MAIGVSADPYGFADTNIKIISNSLGESTSQAQATNELGDITCESVFDTTTERTCVYQTTTDGALSFTSVKPGTVISGEVIKGISVETSSGSRPTISITGKSTKGISGSFKTYEFDIGLTGKLGAQAIGIEATTGNVNSSSASIQVQESQVDDEEGNEARRDIYAGRIEVSNDLVSCSGLPAWTVDTDYTQSGKDENFENKDYPTASVSLFQNIFAD